MVGDGGASFRACDCMNQGELGATTIARLLKIVWFRVAEFGLGIRRLRGRRRRAADGRTDRNCPASLALLMGPCRTLGRSFRTRLNLASLSTFFCFPAACRLCLLERHLASGGSRGCVALGERLDKMSRTPTQKTRRCERAALSHPSLPRVKAPFPPASRVGADRRPRASSGDRAPGGHSCRAAQSAPFPSCFLVGGTSCVSQGAALPPLCAHPRPPRRARLPPPLAWAWHMAGRHHKPLWLRPQSL